MRRQAAAVFAASLVLAWSRAALAQDEASVQPQVLEPEGHHFVFGQGLALLVRRVSIGYELMPRAHHSFGLTLHGQAPGTGAPSIVSGAVAGGGGELGYRYYAGARGPNGPFVGASFLSGYYFSRSSFYDKDAPTTPYAQYGLAMDMGWATHIDRTIVLAMGIGAQRTWIVGEREKLTDYAKMVVGDGVKPRAMIQVGRIF